MEDLNKIWKQTAKSLVIAATDLGESLYATAKYGYDAAVKWAKTDNPRYEASATEVNPPETDETEPAGENRRGEPTSEN